MISPDNLRAEAGLTLENSPDNKGVLGVTVSTNNKINNGGRVTTGNQVDDHDGGRAV
ncbi:hypothetical protein OG339_12780 [Streptosporangium sp. NBC_01495]|uniref:hypothetical protein n=1 Tax=Streptosporangium sp. NBC_01495 TaxID=2903899 RepID=UPI002E30B45B|nr:hypothetical protein [Streptosporangium sp. NBC_01495]